MVAVQQRQEHVDVETRAAHELVLPQQVDHRVGHRPAARRQRPEAVELLAGLLRLPCRQRLPGQLGQDRADATTFPPRPVLDGQQDIVVKTERVRMPVMLCITVPFSALRLLDELLPLDDTRRAEITVFLEFATA
ncbi:MAG: hypothetical protein M3R63_04910, partial [Actinomycetota bacterium]|nr:hypothetical protein [Actinomycetota bacterium]